MSIHIKDEIRLELIILYDCPRAPLTLKQLMSLQVEADKAM